MSQNHNIGEWWEDLAHEDQLSILGEWAEKFPGKFDDSWAQFEEDVLMPSAYYPKNAWTMDAERQEVFIKYLIETGSPFVAFLEGRYADAMEPGWDANSNE